jgi:hypothetical protein
MPNDAEPYEVTGAVTAPMYRVRQWVRGYSPLPGMDPEEFFTAMPPQERPDGESLKRMVRDEQERMVERFEREPVARIEWENPR